MNPLIFRQYDIRGIVSEDLPHEVVVLLGKGFGSWILERGGKKVVVGRDGRVSGPDLIASFTEGLLSTGINVIDVGMVPTPLLYFAHHRNDADGSCQITGSHNPPEYNGFKMMLGKDTLFGDGIQELRKRIENETFLTGEGTRTEIDIYPDYLEYVSNNVKLARPVKVALDSGNGVGGLAAPELFRRMGCDPIEMFSEVDGTFPNHHPDPTVEKNIEQLKEKVLSEGLEFGVGFDGDADRIGVIDDKGNILWGDRLLALFSRYVLKQFPGAAIIGEVKCSKVLYDDIAKHGGQPIMWKTGHSFLKAKLKETQAKLAGEMSGHMFFNDRYFGFDDAIYAAARLAEIVAQESKPLSGLLADLPNYPSTPEIRTDCPDEIKFKVAEALVETFKAKYDVVDIDGVRVNFEHGWGLVRASNTQPVLVLRFEADTEERLQQYKSEMESALERVMKELA